MAQMDLKGSNFKVYLDKFLEYCTRGTVRIEWQDESQRLECAKFLVDRVIVLYIYETFPDIETNGVDIYGGWEGTEEHVSVRDTADPIIIARYWLIRFNNFLCKLSEYKSFFSLFQWLITRF